MNCLRVHNMMNLCAGLRVLSAVGWGECLHVLFSGGQTVQLIMQWRQ